MTVPHRSIERVLVAGRGEIAARVFRACRETGLTSVAVYSEPDAGSSWSRKADQSVALRGTTATETYLNIDAILAAARETGADSVHPGYGFLAENADFAEACAQAGLVFVGPSPRAMRLMGSKVSAREVARSVGVPTVPGFEELAAAPDDLAQAAERLGYPVLIKASAGGGGRGLRVVRSANGLRDEVAAARAEAASAFGDDRVYLERYLDRARHIEVQVLGDGHGNLVHLFERDCSIQRRYQKIIEESPATGCGDELRAAIHEAALALARAASYDSVGTVEFLVDGSGGYWFLEMNARLQVEHPVTEMVTDVDLVACQLAVAAGQPLAFRQADLALHGHAIECRIYAESPAAGFLPSVGRIAYFRRPVGPGVRCDDGIAAGAEISPHYDSMLAKVVAGGWDRREAVRRLAQAVADTVVLGVDTNIPYLQDIISHAAYRAGDIHTRFLDEHFAGWRPSVKPTEEEWLALAAFESLAAASAANDEADDAAPGAWRDPWSITEGWRNVP